MACPWVRADGSRGAFRPGDGELAVAEAAFLARPTEAVDAPVSPRDRLGRFSALPPYQRFRSYVGTGLVATGWVPGRPGDQLGVAVASARNGSPYLQSQWAQGQTSTAAETTLELSYLTQIAKGFTVQPDLQYVTHPNTDGALRNAWVAQLRFELSF